MLSNQTSMPKAIPAPCRAMNIKSKVAENNARWAHRQHVLLSWTIDMTTSMQAFSQFRLRANATAWKSLVSSRTPAELIGRQLDHVETATAQYRDYAQGVSKQMQLCAQDMTPGSTNIGEL